MPELGKHDKAISAFILFPFFICKVDSKRARDRDTVSPCARERERERENEKNVTKNGNQNMPIATKNFLIFLSCLLKNPNTKIYLEGKYRNDLNWIFSLSLSLCSSSCFGCANAFTFISHLVSPISAFDILAACTIHSRFSLTLAASLPPPLSHCPTLPISLSAYVCVCVPVPLVAVFYIVQYLFGTLKSI